MLNILALIPKVHQYVIETLFGPLLWAPVGSKSLTNGKIMFFLAHCIESILGRNNLEFHVFSHGKLEIFQIFLITEKTEKFLPIFLLEILNLDFWISGKI